MQRSNRTRRLVLHRETVRHLHASDLRAIGGARGGEPEPSFYIVCPTISGAVFTCFSDTGVGLEI